MLMRKILLVLAVVFVGMTIGVLPLYAQTPESQQSKEQDIVKRLDSLKRQSAPFASRSLFVVKPERVDEFISQAGQVALFTNGKDGPILYRFFQNIEQPNQFVLFEEWTDSAAVRRQRATPHARAFQARLADLIAKPVQVQLYRPASERAQGDGKVDRSLVEAQSPAQPTASKTRERLEPHGMVKTPFVLLVDVPVKIGGAAVMKDTAVRVQAATLQEPGSIRYGYYQELEQPTSFLLFEWWRAFDDMARHVELPHFQELMKTFAAVGGDGRTVGIYRPLPF